MAKIKANNYYRKGNKIYAEEDLMKTYIILYNEKHKDNTWEMDGVIYQPAFIMERLDKERFLAGYDVWKMKQKFDQFIRHSSMD